MAIEVDETRFVETMKEQAEIGGTDGGGLHRLALSDEDAEIRAWFADQVSEAGLELTVDEFGNMFGYREGTDPDAGTILVGSHLDSQPYGGIYDGAMGVVAALELVRALNDEGIETRHPIEIVNWTNEEGSRFQPAMQGSGVWAGEHDIETEYAKTDADGEVFEEELERIGYKGDVPAEPQRDYDSYLELHIEQGPYLEENDADVGIVTGIVGFTWGAITFHGEADHSGPTPMHYRSDALVAAADVITQIRRIPDTLGERTVGTTGYIDAKPNSINIIPEEVTFTWGFRDPDEAVIEEARARVLAEAEATAEREGVNWEYEDRMWTDPVRFADGCVDAVELATEELGYDGMRIFSGAGHDATHTHKVMDTGMVFSVSEDGKSHSEDEYTSWDDCYKAANTLANAAYELATE
ncbi:Zn-dependent hydrolase [Haloferax volcanii]|uniref:N-carbamoyl-L-amino acid amidohydrolase n=3 Tax=Haloferax volcanii TaxID=2246 RepID=A0A384KF78_HALVD|nr:Zn-dependent hydrolase [Haloferax volcanii]ADE01792.1 amidase (hydantoinase/carbamoylase family) [Haloferax volcanii DS2]ELY31415.1 N-carbamoyl-L-amino acid amidohydrolase [Haloferax volcanii DS2]MBS8120771.1 Zn-dependent hydrolase [Haloferax volcanii]MBS8125808.1 Zn-dependent hydrolase [Haloferax volcanii]MBS8129592.1 Zn-dependent hydrolase [Haloferax volcanii]